MDICPKVEVVGTEGSINIIEIENTYTQEEEKIVVALSTKFKEKWLCVNLGEALVKTYINWHRTRGNLPSELFQSASRLFQERFIRMLLSTGEFPLLHIQDQFHLLKYNLQLTEILTYILSNNFTTVEEEVDKVFGENDKKFWKQFKERMHVKLLSNKPHQLLFDTHTMRRSIMLMGQCQLEIITNQTVFSLMVAVLLLSSQGITLVQR